MDRRVTLISLLVLAAGLALIAYRALTAEPVYYGLMIESAPPEADFELQADSGPVHLSDYRDRWVLLYFGYTYCPDVCPTSLAATAEGLKQLTPDELARVAVILVSVDPKRDTPARLKEYARFFHPAIVGVTGTPEEIAAVAKRYGVFYAEQKVATAGDGYVVDHSADTYVVAADGKLADRIAHATAPDQVAAIIRKHLYPR